MDNEHNKNKKVVGIAYEPGKGLPRVVVKGNGPMAEQILRNRDPVEGPALVKDPLLLQQLYRLPMDAEIGPELFQLVAALLAHVFAVEQRLKEEQG